MLKIVMKATTPSCRLRLTCDNNNNNMLAYKAPVCQKTSEAQKMYIIN